MLHFLIIFIIFMLICKIFNLITQGVCKSNVCLVGKTALITGGNIGIGYETALGLASRGCRVIIASRTANEETKANIIKTTNNPNIIIKQLDLCSLQSIRRFAEDFNRTEERLDILINNAGMGASGNCFTSDGMQQTMQVNHFGSFLLTHLLMDLLKKSQPSRVIFVSSLVAFTNNLTSVNAINNPYGLTSTKASVFSDIFAYGNSKLCNIIICQGFAKRLGSKFNVTVNAVHPGVVRTDIFRKSMNIYFPEALIKLFYATVGFQFKDGFYGAQPTLHAALEASLDGVSGKFFTDCYDFPKPYQCKNDAFREEIWKESERLVALRDSEKLDFC